MKHLHAEELNGNTFGMDVDETSIPYKRFKKHIKRETIINFVGQEVTEMLCVSNIWLGAIMGIVHWLVTQRKDFYKFTIEGLFDEENIYIKYRDGTLDLRERLGVNI